MNNVSQVLSVPQEENMRTNNSSKQVTGTVLGTFEIFRTLDIATREKIAGELQMHKAEKGRFVVSSNNSDTDVYFLISGRIRVSSLAQKNKQIHFEELLPGMMFGELSAIDGLPRSSDCISMETCHLATMSSDKFKQIMITYPQVQHAVLLRLAAMVRGNMQKVYEFSALSVPQRIQCELLRLASDATVDSPRIVLDTAPTHAEIASRVSTHREAVTRELKSLEQTGLITWKKNDYVIHDVARLSELVFV